MKKIESFTVDHNKLLPGIYVSRKDQIGKEMVTSFDIRLKLPNREPAMDVATMHTMEHLGATFLRNHRDWANRVIYFGPMGCRTGFYLLLAGDLESQDIVNLVKDLFEFMSKFEGEIPGINQIECGNCVSHDLKMAKWESNKYNKEVLSELCEKNLIYP